MGLRERMTIATKKPSALRRLDAEELIHRILPRCQVRPYVYNQIATLAKEFQDESDALAQAEAQQEGLDYEPLPRSSFVMHMSADVSKYTMDDRRVDVALLDDILAIPRRSNVSIKLNRGKNVLAEDLKQMEWEYKQVLAAQKRAARAARRNSQGKGHMLQTLTAVLPTLADRPVLYNQVCSLICMSQEENKNSHHENETTMTKKEISNDKDFSSEERWMDVQRLDEVIDFLPHGTPAKTAFESMKMTAVSEAKAAQRYEADRMAKKGFHPLELDDIPLSYY